MKIKEHGESPFKYWVIEDPLPARVAQMIFNELTDASEDLDFVSRMYKYSNYFEEKHAQDKIQNLPPTTRSWLSYTLTQVFIDQIEKLTGLEGLIPDPWLLGGGFHMHKHGGILRPHKDFSMHRKLKLVRKLNFIVYLNKNYEASWGGQLELWSKDMSRCEVKVDPGFNVGVIFETPDAPHGFSIPWNAPDGITRKSLAIYLYTAPTLADLNGIHLSTQFLKTPEEITTPDIEDLREKRNHGRLATNVT